MGTSTPHRLVGTTARCYGDTYDMPVIRYVDTSVRQYVGISVRLHADTSVATLPPFFISFFGTFLFGGFVPFQEMIPMPAAAAESGLELLLTNLWVGKGEKPRRMFFSPFFICSLFLLLCHFFYLGYTLRYLVIFVYSYSEQSKRLLRLHLVVLFSCSLFCCYDIMNSTLFAHL